MQTNKPIMVVTGAVLALLSANVHAKDVKFTGAIQGEMIVINFTSDAQYGNCKVTANYAGKINGKDTTGKLECTGAVSKGSGKICDGMHKMVSPRVTSTPGSCN